MQKFIIFAVLFGMLQLACATKIQCDKTDLVTCKQEVAKILDRDVKIAHITAIRRIVRRYIDVLRELTKKYEQDREYVDVLRTTIRDLKTELEVISEKWNDTDELVKAVKRIKDLVKRDNLKSNKGTVTDETLNKLYEELELKQTVYRTLQVLVEEITHQLKEIYEELKEKNIKIEDVEEPIYELLQLYKQTKYVDDEQVKKLNETLKKLVEKLELRYTKYVDLEYIERIKNLL